MSDAFELPHMEPPLMPDSGAVETARGDVARIAMRLFDDAYTAWNLAEIECHNALRAWLDSGSGHDDAYRTYRAALDREEAAARDLHRLTTIVQT
jgi:hypothetical protein